MGPAPGISAERHTTRPPAQARPAGFIRRSLSDGLLAITYSVYELMHRRLDVICDYDLGGSRRLAAADDAICPDRNVGLGMSAGMPHQRLRQPVHQARQ